MKAGEKMLLISLMELEHKEYHSHAHKLLRECLKTYRIDYNEDTPVVKNDMGKPSLAEHPDIHYNISHAKGISACIVSDRECGIDCEQVRQYRPNVAKRAFSESEQELLESLPESERDMMFTRLWTLKESYVKAIGTGISYPLNTVGFAFSGDEIIADKDECRFRQYLINGGKYVVSVCELYNSNR